MPIVKAAPVISAYKITQADKDKKVYYTLRVARADTKLIGKRAVRAKKAAEKAVEDAKVKT